MHKLMRLKCLTILVVPPPLYDIVNFEVSIFCGKSSPVFLLYLYRKPNYINSIMCLWLHSIILATNRKYPQQIIYLVEINLWRTLDKIGSEEVSLLLSDSICKADLWSPAENSRKTSTIRAEIVDNTGNWNKTNMSYFTHKHKYLIRKN